MIGIEQRPQYKLAPSNDAAGGVRKEQPVLLPAEQRLLQLLTTDHTQPKIASMLGVSVSTLVNGTQKELFVKLGASNPIHAVLVGYVHGLVDATPLKEDYSIGGFKSITDHQRQLLEAVVEDNGKMGASDEHLMQRLKWTKGAVKVNLEKLFDRFGFMGSGSRLQLALFYFIYKSEQQAAAVDRKA